MKNLFAGWLPKGSGPKGFKGAAEQTPAPDTRYLDELIRHSEAGIVRKFQIIPEQGEPITINTSFGWMGRKVDAQVLARQIHEAIEASGGCKLSKLVERSEGRPLQAVSLGTFAPANTALDNPDTRPEYPEEHPAPAEY